MAAYADGVIVGLAPSSAALLDADVDRPRVAAVADSPPTLAAGSPRLDARRRAALAVVPRRAAPLARRPVLAGCASSGQRGRSAPG